MKNSFLFDHKSEVEEGVNLLFQRYAYVATITQRIRIPSYETLVKQLGEDLPDSKQTKQAYSDLNEFPEIFGSLMSKSIVEYGKLLGLYPHRSSPIKPEIIYNIEKEGDTHLLDILYLIGYDSFNEDLEKGMMFFQKDVTALTTSTLTAFSSDTFMLARTEAVADFLLSNIIWSFDESPDTLKTKQCYERDRRFLTDNEKKEEERRKTLPELLQALHREKDSMLLRRNGVYFFFLLLHPLTAEEIKTLGKMSGGEAEKLAKLFFYDPKPIVEFALDTLERFEEDIQYVVYPEKDEKGSILYYKVGILFGVDEESEKTNPVLRNNPLVNVITTALSYGFFDFYCLDNIDLKDQINLVVEHIQVPQRQDEITGTLVPIEGAVYFNPPRTEKTH